MFHLVALVVVASIIAHSSTDVVVARWFHPRKSVAGPADASLGDGAE
jgi:hypothetical protein